MGWELDRRASMGLDQVWITMPPLSDPAECRSSTINAGKTLVCGRWTRTSQLSDELLCQRGNSGPPPSNCSFLSSSSFWPQTLSLVEVFYFQPFYLKCHCSQRTLAKKSGLTKKSYFPRENLVPKLSQPVGAIREKPVGTVTSLD